MAQANNGCETAITCAVTSTNRGDRDAVNAGGAVNTGSTTTTTTTPGRTSSTRGESSNGSTSGTSGLTGNGTGAYQQAQKAKDDANTKMIMGAAIAAMSLPGCMAKQVMSCVMMAAGIALAAFAKGKKDEAQDLQNNLGVASTGGSDTPGSTTTTSTSGNDAEGSNAEGQLNTLRGQLAGAGYTVGADGTITGPNGSQANAFGLSPAALKGMGMSQSDADRFASEFEKRAAEAAKKAPINVASSEGGGGSGGGSAAGVGGDPSNAPGANTAKSEKTSIDRDPAAWAGYFKQHGDSLIGVSQSDIFLMVHNRVQIERKAMGH